MEELYSHVRGRSIPQSTFEQLPTVLPSMASRWDKPLGGVLRWVTLRVGRLTATSTSLHEWGREIEADGAEWWSEPAREQWARELDALFFHLFGVPREDISYVMDSFEIVRRRDEQAHREYRTKRLVLEAYDQLALFGPAS